MYTHHIVHRNCLWFCLLTPSLVDTKKENINNCNDNQSHDSIQWIDFVTTWNTIVFQLSATYMFINTEINEINEIIDFAEIELIVLHQAPLSFSFNFIWSHIFKEYISEASHRSCDIETSIQYQLSLAMCAKGSPAASVGSHKCFVNRNLKMYKLIFVIRRLKTYFRMF